MRRFVSLLILIGISSAPLCAPVPDESDLVFISGGVFTMGYPGGDSEARQRSARPRHEVHLSPFVVSRNLVTVSDYLRFIDETGFPPHEAFESGTRIPADRKDGDSPIANVTWRGANAYCEWLTHGDLAFRLPTEAEWEYLATNGGTTRYPWGDTATQVFIGRESASPSDLQAGEYAWLGDFPVGSCPSNANQDGVLDLVMSVMQWCQDYHNPRFYRSSPELDPIETDVSNASRWSASDSPERVVRGGFNIPTPNPSLLDAISMVGNILPRGYTRHRFTETGYHSQTAIGFRWVVEGWPRYERLGAIHTENMAQTSNLLARKGRRVLRKAEGYLRPLLVFSWVYPLIGAPLFGILLWGVTGSFLARRAHVKNRNPYLWGIIGGLFWGPGFVIMALLPSRVKESVPETESSEEGD